MKMLEDLNSSFAPFSVKLVRDDEDGWMLLIDTEWGFLKLAGNFPALGENEALALLAWFSQEHGFSLDESGRFAIESE
jgi:hypothetical protein